MLAFKNIHIAVVVFACNLFIANNTFAAQKPEIDSSTGLSEFEREIRAVAEKTAAEEKAKKEEARLAAKSATRGGSGVPFKVFKYHKNGTVMFADSAPYQIPYKLIIYNSCYACSLNSKINWSNTKLHLTEFSNPISLAAKSHGVDPAFIRAIIHAESAFNPLAQSRKGAVGLMQLMPGTASDMGVLDSSNPNQNINGGVKYLALLLQRFNNNHVLAAAAYNAGPNAVLRYNGIPPYEETQTYVKRVSILLQRYKDQKMLANN